MSRLRMNDGAARLWSTVGLVVLGVVCIITVILAFSRAGASTGGGAPLASVSYPVSTQPAKAVDTQPGNSVSAQPTEAAKKRPVALFIGDSYSAGAGVTSKQDRWTTLVAAKLGWTEVNRARGGTGYFATSGMKGCGLEYCPSYIEMIAQTNATPAFVVISGGRSDGQRQGYESKVEETINAAQKKWPKAQIILTSLLWDDSPAPAWVSGADAAIEGAAKTTGATYLDLGSPLKKKWNLVSKGGVHPNSAGYKVIADAVVAAWRAR